VYKAPSSGGCFSSPTLGLQIAIVSTLSDCATWCAGEHHDPSARLFSPRAQRPEIAGCAPRLRCSRHAKRCGSVNARIPRRIIAALGGAAVISPQRRKLIDLAARASLYLDHVDAWLAEQQTLINRRSRAVLPILIQRQTIAEHLARLLDKIGLDRVPAKVADLDRYIADRYGDKSQ
jgi:hypothetical protein